MNIVRENTNSPKHQEPNKPKVDASLTGTYNKVCKVENDLAEFTIGAAESIAGIIQQMKVQDDRINYLLNFIMKTIPVGEINEIDFETKDFEQRFGNLVGAFYFDSEVKAPVKVNFMTKGWNNTGTEDIPESEDKVYIFNHLEKGELRITASDPKSALEQLKHKIKHPIELV